MRTLAAGELARIMGQTGRWLFRVEVKRRADTAWTDLSAVAGGDWVTSVRTDGETPDQPVSQFTVAFLRRADGRSLAPGMSADSFNRNAAAVFKPLLGPRSQIRVSAANLIRTDPDGSAVWRRWLEGEIEDPSWPGDDVVCLCNSLDGILQRTQIEAKEVRGAPDPGVPMADELQGLLNRWRPSGDVTLNIPFWPEKGVGEYVPEGSLGEQARLIAQQIGWDLRYRWSEPHGDFRYTLYQPPRDKTTFDLTVAGSEVMAVSSLQSTPRWLRNAFSISFRNAKTGNREVLHRENAGSIADFDRVWMGLVEPDGSPINDPTSAGNLLAFADSDLSRPITDISVELPFIPWLELHDRLAIQADGARFDYDTAWSVTGLSHEVNGDDRKTVAQLRGGQPVGQYLAWHKRESIGQGVLDPASQLSLIDFHESGRTDTTVTFIWRRGAEVARVRVFEGTYKQPYTLTDFPGENAAQAILDTENEWRVRVPEGGQVTYIQFEPYSADGRAGPVIRVSVSPPDREDENALKPQPRIWASLVLGSGPGLADLYLRVSDPLNFGGNLYAWTNPNSVEQPNPNRQADGVARILPGQNSLDPTTPFAAGSGTVYLLNDIPNHAGAPKRVYFDFITTDQRIASLEVQLRTMLDVIVDQQGELRAGSIRRATAFAAGLDVVLSVDALPTSRIDSDILLFQGKLYRWDGARYTTAVPAGDLTGVITETQIADDAISTPKLQANSVTANNILAGEILARLVTTDKVIAGAIAAGAIKAEAISAGAVTAVAISALAIETGHLAAGAVTAAKILAGEVKTDHLAAGAVTAPKISVGNLREITPNLGIVLTGRLQNVETNPTRYLWLNGAATDPFLKHEKFALMNDGRAEYSGQIRLLGGTGIAFLTSAAAKLGTVEGTTGGVTVKSGNGKNEVRVLDTGVEIVGNFKNQGALYTPNKIVGPTNGAHTIHWLDTNSQTWRINSASTLTMGNGKPGQVVHLIVTFELATGHLITFANVRWPNGTAPTYDNTIDTETVWEFINRGTYWIGRLWATKIPISTAAAPVAPTSLSLFNASECIGSTASYAIRVSVGLGDTAAYTKITDSTGFVYLTLDPGVSTGTFGVATDGVYTFTAHHEKDGKVSAKTAAQSITLTPLACGGAL